MGGIPFPFRCTDVLAKRFAIPRLLLQRLLSHPSISAPTHGKGGKILFFCALGGNSFRFRIVFFGMIAE